MGGKGQSVVNGGLGTRSSGEEKHLGLNAGNGKVGPSNTKYIFFMMFLPKIAKEIGQETSCLNSCSLTNIFQ